eukprot:GHVU01109343.1.p1 GENE.GHVU01109343.1~~GHVU01109343.1.p1  ORF type:complete len:324 (-),score=23.40 GHVU01109343.1:51-1022(-)
MFPGSSSPMDSAFSTSSTRRLLLLAGFLLFSTTPTESRKASFRGTKCPAQSCSASWFQDTPRQDVIVEPRPDLITSFQRKFQRAGDDLQSEIDSVKAEKGSNTDYLSESILFPSRFERLSETEMSSLLTPPGSPWESKTSPLDYISHAFTCDELIREAKSSQLVVHLMNVIVNTLRNPTEQSDKKIIQAISFLKEQRNFDLTDVIGLSDCVIDTETEQGIFQRLVYLGMVGSLKSGAYGMFASSSRKRSIDRVDRAGNNLLHLAVMSRNPHVVNEVLMIEDAALMLKMVNHSGALPVDVALQEEFHDPAIASTLKRIFSLLSY